MFASELYPEDPDHTHQPSLTPKQRFMEGATISAEDRARVLAALVADETVRTRSQKIGRRYAAQLAMTSQQLEAVSDMVVPLQSDAAD